MTTENAAPWLTAIAAQLSTLDPENAARYSANAEAARAEIDTLEAELRTTLAPVGDAGLIMYHGAYGYFAHQFDLNVLGTVRLGDAAEPGAARIAALLEALSHANATCIFPEANHAPNHVDLVAAEIGLRMGDALDPAGVMRDPGPDHYAATMRAMAQTIADCVTRP
jgi:zinc transport system substrate-binding protein